MGWTEFKKDKPKINDFCLFIFDKEGHYGNWVCNYKGEDLFIEMMEVANAKWLALPPINQQGEKQ